MSITFRQEGQGGLSHPRTVGSWGTRVRMTHSVATILYMPLTHPMPITILSLLLTIMLNKLKLYAGLVGNDK